MTPAPLTQANLSDTGHSAQGLIIRPLEPRDNPQLTQLITDVWAEFDDVIYFDDPSIPASITPIVPAAGETLHPEEMSLSQRYQTPAGQPTDRGYWVIEDTTTQRILGGGGFAHLIGAAPSTCELQKLYLLNELRGKGMGSRLLQVILEQAAQAGYEEIYLESIPEMAGAVNLYKKFGFQDAIRKGTTGHWRCEIFMSRSLATPIESREKSPV